MMILFKRNWSFILMILSFCGSCQATDYPGYNDSVIRRIVEDFQQMCPNTDLCYNSTSVISSNFQCCSACRCDETCGRECCPDKLAKRLSDSDLQMIKTPPFSEYECVFPQFRAYDSEQYNAPHSYTFIGRCPTGYDNKDVQHKCHRGYEEFDFQDDLNAMLPLSSENNTFKNYFCWLCHGTTFSSMTDFVRWTPTLICEAGLLLIETFQDLPKQLSENGFCNLIFTKPDNVSAHSCNTDYIDRCNTTGNWLVYDTYLEESCLSYTSIYTSIYTSLYEYKNVHCFLCNGNDETSITDLCFPILRGRFGSSFVALLDFNDIEDDSDSTALREKDFSNSDNCPEKYFYDKYTDVCRELYCAHGMQISKNKDCIPMLTQVTFEDQTLVSLSFMLSLHVQESDKPYYYSRDMITRVRDLVKTLVELSITDSDIAICDFRTLVKLNEVGYEIMNDIHLKGDHDFSDDIRYIAFIIQVNASKYIDYNAIINHLALAFTMSTLMGRISLLHRKANPELLESVLDNNNWIMYASKEKHSRLMYYNAAVGIILWEDVLQEGCISFIGFEPKPFCSKLNISNEYVLDINDFGVTINLSDKTLSFDSFLMSENDDSVYVCLDDYLAKMKNETTKNYGSNSLEVPKDTLELAILTVVCLTLSLASLVTTLVIYCLLSELRSTPGMINMALSISLVVSQALTLTNSVVEVSQSRVCSAIGILLHLSLLSGFFWMFVGTFHMTRVFGRTISRFAQSSRYRPFLYYLGFVETLSILLVAAVAVISTVASTGEGFGYGGFPCYIRNARMIMYFVAIPLGLVVTSNGIMFLFVIIKISRIPEMNECSTADRNKVIIFAKLSTITGLTWIFGFIYQFSKLRLFVYLFILFNASQGVFLMFAFVVNPRVLKLLKCRKKKAIDISKYTSNSEQDGTSGTGLSSF